MATVPSSSGGSARAAPADGGVEVERVEPARGPAVGDGDDERAARPQHAVGLLQRPARGVGDVLDHLEQQHRVGAVVRERQLRRVGVDHRQPRESLARLLEQLGVALHARPPPAPAGPGAAIAADP